jgi:hypothetical protein
MVPARCPNSIGCFVSLSTRCLQPWKGREGTKIGLTLEDLRQPRPGTQEPGAEPGLKTAGSWMLGGVCDGGLQPCGHGFFPRWSSCDIVSVGKMGPFGQTRWECSDQIWTPGDSADPGRERSSLPLLLYSRCLCDTKNHTGRTAAPCYTCLPRLARYGPWSP